MTQNGKKVYIVENPAIFSMLIKEKPEAGILCGNGQLRLASHVLLDLFDKETEFLYAGDFDPEGLLIAQNLKEKYGDRMHLWKYEKELYEMYRSEVEISEKSLKKLDNIYLKELLEIAGLMKKQKKATYQEALWKEYIR